MQWFTRFLSSSIGKKLIMSLTGLFLIMFLIVHLLGNLQLLADDGGESFNKYAYLMTHNPLIKFISYSLYALIVIHAIQGIVLAVKNRSAKGGKYAVQTKDNASWASKNMALLGILILAFLLLHMGDFWWKMKRKALTFVTYDDMKVPVQDLYERVNIAFQQEWIVIAYLIGLLALAFHLKHGFISAFDTLGWRHSKYEKLLSAIAWLYTILVPLAFAIIPIYHYLYR